MHAITATAVDENGEVATVTKAINSIIDPQDVPFRAIIDNFKSNLASGNTAGALALMSDSAQPTYGPLFAALAPALPQIVSEWSQPAIWQWTSTRRNLQ